MCKMNKKDTKPLNFTSTSLEVRLFYIRISPCSIEAMPDHLTLRHLRREIGVSLDINGSHLPSSDAASITLRRDRVNRDSSEVTYVSTDSVRVSGSVEFEVVDEKVLLLCGSLERVEGCYDSTWSDGNKGWNMECCMVRGTENGRKGGGGGLVKGKFGVGSPLVEVYIAGCCSGVPVILRKVIEVSPRKKVPRARLLEAIPEGGEGGKEDGEMNGLVRQRKLQITDVDGDDYDSEGKAEYGYYPDDIYVGEDGQMSYFNAGVRVGVGIGLGMCLGVGIGVGLLMRSYQSTTRNFRRRFF